MTTRDPVGSHLRRLVSATVVLIFVLAIPGGLRAQDDPFALKNQAVEPKKDPQPQQLPDFAAKGPTSPAKESLLTTKLAELVTFEVTLQPAQAKPGDVVRLVLQGKLKKGFHTYPVTQRTAEQNALSVVRYELPPGVQALWPLAESAPRFKKEKAGKKYEIFLEFEDAFTWSQDLLILPAARPGPNPVKIKLNLQVCDDHGCFGPAPYRVLETLLDVKEGGVQGLSPDLTKRLQAKEPAVLVLAIPPELLPGGGEGPGQTSKDKAALQPGSAPGGELASLLGLLGSAFVGAFLMLLTPCVFPMIPITVNFFLKQSEKEHHNPLLTACVYSGTIIFLLTLVMLALGRVVIHLANDPWFNLALGAVLVFFALSLFGMYEIELPTGLARFTSAREGQGGYIGAVFMALTFTITSFTCTGPFLGALLAPVAGLQPPFIHLLLAALVYSTTFAAPFFILALFPSLMKKLPKSGGWLNSVKVVMGFLELGAALKFLANTDLAWSPGNPRLFNFDTVLCAWIALSVLAALYLIGVFRLPHDDAVEHVGVLRMLFASLFFGLALYMAPALWGQRLHGLVGENIIAFLPPNFNQATGRETGQNGEKVLAWHLDYLDAWKEATRTNKLIFIDFTGQNCTNCRYNEENVFPTSHVSPLLARYARVRLYTDSVPNPKLSYAEAKEQGERNSQWREQVAHGITNPTYVILQPDQNEVFENGLPKGKVLDKRDGTIFDVGDFVQFLEKPQPKVVASSIAQQDKTAPGETTTTIVPLKNPTPAKAPPTEIKGELPWIASLASGLKKAQAAKGLVFVDFTGIGCVNCKVNERTVFTQAAVKDLLGHYTLVQLFTDKVPEKHYRAEELATSGDGDRRTRDAAANLKFQEDRFGTVQLPFYVILEPQTKGGFHEVSRYTEGRINDPDTFRRFLREPLVTRGILPRVQASLDGSP